MSIRSSLDVIRRRLGLQTGRCPACHAHPLAARFIIFEPIGFEMSDEERSRKKAAAPPCPQCGRPALTFIWPDSYPREGPP